MRGDYTDARGMIRSRIELDPNNFQAQYVMAEIYRMEKNDFGELQHLLELHKIGKYPGGVSPIKIANRIGELYYNQENYTESFEAYYEAYMLHSKNEEALVHLAFLAIGKGEFEIAERFFKILMEITPSIPEYRLARAVGLSMLGNKLALEEFETVIEKKKSDLTANFLTALQAFKQGKHERCLELIDGIFDDIDEKPIKYVAAKLGCAAAFGNEDYPRALNFATGALKIATEEFLDKERYDAKLSVAYMAILAGKLELANEHLLELEIQNPHDDLIIRVSDFRMDLEENVTAVDQISPRGFDFSMHLQDWVKKRFPENIIYRMSGLKMDADFQINLISGDQIQRPRMARSDIDYESLIDQFNNLKDAAFESACEKIIKILGYNVQKALEVRERDGKDFIAQERMDKTKRALFRLRKWKNQPISDIFLRDLQNYMNELKVSNGYVIAGARLTAGAEQALQNLKKIEVINEEKLGELLAQIFGTDSI
jgi:hypothetical protein